MLFALQESLIFTISLRPSPISFVHCHGFLRNLSMTLHSIRWYMAYFLFNFQDFPLLWTASAISIVSMGFPAIFLGFPLLWAASAKLLKKLQFPLFQWGVLPFSSFACVLGRSIRENCSKSCYFNAFRIARKPHFYDFIAPKPNFFRPLPRFPAEFEYDTTYN